MIASTLRDLSEVLSVAMLGGKQGQRHMGVGLDAISEAADLAEDGFRRAGEVKRGDLDRLARVPDLVSA